MRFHHFSPPAPNWLRFAPFYVLVSSPLQEISCRAIPRLIAERLGANATSYAVFSSLLFSLMHFAYGDAALLINTFFAGVVWSVTYLLTGSSNSGILEKANDAACVVDASAVARMS